MYYSLWNTCFLRAWKLSALITCSIRQASSRATPAQAQAVHKFIRDHIAKVDANIAEQVIIQYGGSVNASNAAELFAQPDIDGALVGGASLKADAFAVIVKAAEAAKQA